MSALPRFQLRWWERHRRGLTVGLAALGAAAFAGSWFLPWWSFDLFAPQYPKGLELVVSLTGVTGDVSEINIINHYIGMAHLDDAAKVEREWGGRVIALLGFAIIAVVLGAGRRLGWVAALLGFLLPVGFIADTTYWLYRFGHDLDPKAPVHIPPFTPTLFGEGKVGQFVTIATPSTGFWLAVAGVAVLGIAVWQRQRVCHACPLHDECRAICPHGFVRAPRG